MEWSLEEILGIIAAFAGLFGILVLLLLQSNAFGDITSCDKNPELYGCAGRKTLQDNVAAASAAAIPCAVNSVATGAQRCSPEQLDKGKSTTWVSCAPGKAQQRRLGTVTVTAWQDIRVPLPEDTSEALKKAEQGAQAQCAQGATAKLVDKGSGSARFRCELSEEARQQNAAADCSAKFGDSAVFLKLLQFESDGASEVYSCTKQETLSCTVHDFALPQNVEDPTIWTRLWGDPAYLLYAQTFPPEEVTWGAKLSWVAVLPIAFAVFAPTSRVAGAAKAAGIAGTEQAVRAGAGLAGVAGSEEAVKTAATSALKSNLAKTAVAGTAAYGAEQAANIGAATSSYAAKFDDYPNTIILKQPSLLSRFDKDFGIQKFPLDSATPVLIAWSGGTLRSTQYQTFHLVSPCSLDSFTFQPRWALCDKYIEKGEHSICKPKGLEPSNKPACGVFTKQLFTSFGGEAGPAAFDRAQSLRKADKTLFAQSEGSVRQIIIPKELIGERLVLNNLLPTGKLDGPKTAEAAGKTVELNCDNSDSGRGGWIEGGENIALCDYKGPLPHGVAELQLYGEEDGSKLKGVSATFEDGSRIALASNDGKTWSELTVRSEDLEMMLADLDENGNPSYLQTLDCAMPAVVAEDLKYPDVKTGNYCLRYKNVGAELKSVSNKLAGGLAIGLSFVAPQSRIVTALLRATQLGAAVYSLGELMGDWPKGYAS